MNEVEQFAGYARVADRLIDGATKEPLADAPHDVLLHMVRAERRGLWLDPDPMAPWEWRHR